MEKSLHFKRKPKPKMGEMNLKNALEQIKNPSLSAEIKAKPIVEEPRIRNLPHSDVRLPSALSKLSTHIIFCSISFLSLLC